MADTEPTGNGARQVESVQRAMQVLHLFASVDAETGISVSEAAQRLGVTKSTVSRLLATMAASRVIVVGAGHRYYVGPVAFEIGSQFAGAAIARSMRPVLRDLAIRTSSTAQMGTLDGNQVLYLSVAAGPGRLRVVASAGDVIYAHASAIGKVLLANLPATTFAEVIGSLTVRGKLPISGPKTFRDVDALSSELHLTKQRGYSITNEEGTAGVVSIGVRIEGHYSVPLAISIAFPVGQYRRADFPDLVTALRDAADAASGRLFSSVIAPTA